MQRKKWLHPSKKKGLELAEERDLLRARVRELVEASAALRATTRVQLDKAYRLRQRLR
jgi:uncharacterized coiled-coil DUF342 family protein